jgi:hypothetical protein
METLQRAIDAAHLSIPLERRAFIDWAGREGFQLPPGLNAKPHADPSGEAAKADEINPKTQHVFYQVLIGMAIKHYDLDPDYDPEGNDKSQAFSLMVTDLQNVGAPVTEKTLREHTKNALRRARAQNVRFKKPSGKRPNR